MSSQLRPRRKAANKNSSKNEKIHQDGKDLAISGQASSEHLVSTPRYKICELNQSIPTIIVFAFNRILYFDISIFINPIAMHHFPHLSTSHSI